MLPGHYFAGHYFAWHQNQKTEVEAPNNTEVLVIFRDKANKEKFLKSAGSWKNIDIGIFNDILKSRENLRERNFEL